MRRARFILAALSVLFAVVVCVAPALAKKKTPDHRIDLNAANEKELEELPGVGPTTAKAIIQFREKSGRFKRVEDLLVIRGISEAKLAKMRPYLTIASPPAAKPASSASLPSAQKTPPPKTSP